MFSWIFAAPAHAALLRYWQSDYNRKVITFSKAEWKGKPTMKVNGAHTATLKRSGVRRFRLYDLRHTYATRAIAAGVDLLTLAANLGHSKIEMVTRYAHPTDQNKIAAMHKMEAAG